MMLTDHDYSDNGIVLKIGANRDSAYGIIKIKYAIGAQHVFTHEVGHIFGAQHQFRSWKDDPEACNYAWKIKDGWFYSVMYAGVPTPWAPTPSFKILNFSDPEILAYSYPSGSFGSIDSFIEMANNAGIIRETGCQVAGFMGDQELVVMIDGDNNLCQNPEYYEAIITSPPTGNPGQPPYTFQWSYNLDGLFSDSSPGFPFLGTSNVVSIPPPNIGPCSFFFLRVKVTSSDGVTGEAIKRIATSCQPCPVALLSPRQAINQQASIIDQCISIIYPNPIENQINIEWFSDNEQPFEITVFTIDGKIVTQKNGTSIIGKNFYHFNLDETLPKGIYHFWLKSTDKLCAKNIIIN